MKNSDIKDHLIDTTVMLLSQVYELEEITIRKIAEEAHVATGLINYHFESKEALLIASINKMIDTEAKHSMSTLYDKSIPPKGRLRQFLVGLSDTITEYRKYSSLILKHEVLSPDFYSAEVLEPVLREIYPKLDTEKIKFLAIQLIAPLQYMFLKQDGLYKYMGKSINYHIAVDNILSNLGLQ